MKKAKIDQAVAGHTALLNLFQDRGTELAALTDRVVERFHQRGRLLIAGSGPLGTIAQLVAIRFSHHQTLERPQLPALALSGEAALAAALARQGQSREYLARQLRVVAQPGDLLLILSDGQRDEAVIEALAAARQLGCATVLVQGQGEVPDPPADFVFQFDSDSPPRIAEGTLLFGQLLCELVEAELFGF